MEEKGNEEMREGRRTEREVGEKGERQKLPLWERNRKEKSSD